MDDKNIELHERIAALERGQEEQCRNIEELKKSCEKCRVKKIVDGIIWIIISGVAIAVIALVIKK